MAKDRTEVRAGSVYRKPNRISVHTKNWNLTDIFARNPRDSVYFIIKYFYGFMIEQADKTSQFSIPTASVRSVLFVIQFIFLLYTWTLENWNTLPGNETIAPRNDTFWFKEMYTQYEQGYNVQGWTMHKVETSINQRCSESNSATKYL